MSIWRKLFHNKSSDSITVMKEAVVNRNKDGIIVTIKKSVIEEAMRHPNYREAGEPKEKLIVALACSFAKCSEKQSISYMEHPNISGMISEKENADTVFKGPMDTDWQVPIYIVYLPPL